MALLTITGVSGAGKDTLLAGLRAHIPTMHPLPSTTTRARREGEQTSYYTFVALAEFQKLKQSGVFAWALPYGEHWYGTRVEDIRHALHSDEVFVAILVLPALQPLRDIVANSPGARLISFYLAIDDVDEAVRRMRERKDSEDQIALRLQSIAVERAQIEASSLPLHRLDASQPKEAVLAQALDILRTELPHAL